VYKILKAHPTKEQITNFNMKIAEEDDYVDYVIDLNTLDEDAKKELCSLYDIDDKDLNQKEKLQLSISSSV
jgi:6-pyruvoyl-tetrahydropterin synthase